MTKPDDPNLYLAVFETYYGCSGCGASWAGPNTVTCIGKLKDVTIAGYVAASGAAAGLFYEGPDGYEVSGGIIPDKLGAYECHTCGKWWDHPFFYGSQEDVDYAKQELVPDEEGLPFLGGE